MKQTNARREKGMGTIYARDTGKWVGRLTIGVKQDGTPKYKCFSGKTEAEVKRKIREYNSSGFLQEATKATVADYVENWLKIYKKGTLKRSSYDTLEGTVKLHIIPALG